MRITQINAPVSTLTSFDAGCCKPRKSMPLYTNNLQADTVSFTSNGNKALKEAVDYAFSKLTQYRTKKELGTFIGKSGDANVYLKETLLGKRAQLCLTDGDFNGKKVVNLEISRELNKPAKVKDNYNEISPKEAEEIAVKYLKDLK